MRENTKTSLNYGIISNHLANSFSSDFIPHLHGSGVGGGGGVDFSSLCSKQMFYILSVHQPAGMSYMI